MTRAEFDVWIEQHYTQLLAVARRRTNTDEDAADAVHAAVAQTLASGRCGEIQHPWTWMVNAVRGKAKDGRRSEDRRTELHREVKNVSRAGLSLGWKRPAPRAE